MPDWMLLISAWAITITGFCSLLYLCFVLSSFFIDKALKTAKVQREIAEAVWERRQQKKEDPNA